jgi:predicted Fe-S protein YdhL (DUF1289 family)
MFPPQPQKDPMRAPIRTPCVQVCSVDADGELCLGCFRTCEEIGAWSVLSPEQRDDIMAALPMRRLLIGPLKFGEA